MDNIDRVKLPSNGLLGTPAEVVIRGMKGKEISTLYSSLNEPAIEAIIKTVTDPSLDPASLCDEDKYYILHKTRTLTFGDDIKQTLKCPFCGNIEEHDVSYANFESKSLELEDLDITIELDNGMKVTRQVATKVTWNAINSHKEKRNLPPEYSFILLIASKIKTIDGKRMSIGELVGLLENLPGNDLVRLSEKLVLKFGLDTTYKVPCKKCKLDITGGIGINADMFR